MPSLRTVCSLALWTHLCLAHSALAQPVDFALFQSAEKAPASAVMMRFVHSIAGVGAIRVDLDGLSVVDSLEPRDRTSYLQLAAVAGVEHQLRVYDIAEGPPVLLLDMPVFFNGNVYATAVLVGDSDQSIVAFTTDSPYDGDGRFAWVDSINGDPDSQAFAVFDRATGETLLTTLYFAGGHAEGIEAGTYDLDVRRHNQSDVVLALNDVTFEAGQKYILLFSQPLLDTTSASTAFVRGDRFRLTAEWRSFDGTNGAGQRYGTSADSAEFWFFSPSNIELIAKVIDGSPLNQRYWVFSAALSNVQFDLTVFDRQARSARLYHNDEGIFASLGDIDAFPAP